MADARSYTRFFPYEAPYENQRDAMDRIYNALGRGQDVLFEGACGTGKTLSALVPALEVARAEDRTVVITTNVHQQFRQFVAEARAIIETEPIRAVVFKGKTSMCHLEVGYEECQALRENTRALVDAQAEYTRLQDRERSLLEASQAGDAGAAEARAAVADELEALGAEVADLREANVCAHYEHNLVRETDEFFQWLFDDVRTPEEIYEHADEHELCGYELLKEGLDGVDLVVCNYHHLLDPSIREHFFRWLGRDPSDVIAVFDEAHNLEDAARDHATRTLSERTLASALDELTALARGDRPAGVTLAAADDTASDVVSTDTASSAGTVDEVAVEGAKNVLEAFHDALIDTYDAGLGFGEREAIGKSWVDVAVANENRRDDLTLAFLDRYAGTGIDEDLAAATTIGGTLDRAYDEQFRRGDRASRTECPTLSAATFVEAWIEEGATAGLHPVVSVRRDASTDEVYGRAELFACIPRSVTGELLDELAASVLMSATLQPFPVTETVLGLEDPVTLAYGLEFPENRRRTFAVATPALFANDRDDPEVQETVATTLRDAIRFTPGNTLAFFPSYGEAARYAGLLGDDVTGGSDGTGDSNGVGGSDGIEGSDRVGGSDETGAGGSRERDGRHDVVEGSDAGTDVGSDANWFERSSAHSERSIDETAHGVVEGTDVPIYLDEPGQSVEELRRAFVAEDGAVMLTSLWGTLAEGVSFDGDDATTVLVVGVPYPRLDDRAEAVQAAYEVAFEGDDVGWEYAVEIPTIRRTRQALGRVIRSPSDVGVRALLDRRYTAADAADLGKYSVHGTFPPEERRELVDVHPEKLKFAMLNFFTEHDAYDGSPPTP